MLQRERGPEMPQSREGKNWSNRLKLYIGAKVVSGWVHSLVTIPANAYDLTPAPQLRRGNDPTVRGEAGHSGIHKRHAHLGGV